MTKRTLFFLLVILTAVVTVVIAFRQKTDEKVVPNPVKHAQKVEQKAEVEKNKPVEEPVKRPAKTKEVSLFFADSSEEYLIREDRTLPLEDATPTGVLTELAKGPTNKGLQPTLPPGTQILSVKREGDLLVTDFNEKLRQNIGGGSTSEIMAVYSVVSTLTELTGAKKVQFLIAGKSVDTLNGHLDLSEPVEPDPGVIK